MTRVGDSGPVGLSRARRWSRRITGGLFARFLSATQEAHGQCVSEGCRRGLYILNNLVYPAAVWTSFFSSLTVN